MDDGEMARDEAGDIKRVQITKGFPSLRKGWASSLLKALRDQWEVLTERSDGFRSALAKDLSGRLQSEK